MKVELFVCRYGFITLEANSVKAAIEAAQKEDPEKAAWSDHMNVTDYEVKEE